MGAGVARWNACRRGQQACLVCPEANEKECRNCKVIKKAETKNHHQIILGNHEFSGKRLEEKSEKGKRYHRKCEREFQKLRRSIPTTKLKVERARGAGKRESRKRGKEIIHFAATTSLTPREKEWKYEAELERSGQTRIGFTAWGLRESEKRNQAIGNSRESNVRESSGTADSEYPSLVFTQIITRS